MARPEFTARFAAAIVIPALVIAAIAMPASGKKNDPAATGDPAAAVDPNVGEVPTAVPVDSGPNATPGAGTDMFPNMPGFGEADEVGGIIQPERIAQLVQECDSISVAGLAVAAHNCANGIDVSGTLPPGAPWTVFVASKDAYLMVAPTVKSGKKAEIELPYSAEPLRNWVHKETGIRLRRAR